MHGARKLGGIALDVRFELLATGLARLLDEHLGVVPTPFHAAGRPPGLTIADFGPAAPQAEARIGELLAYARRGRLLVIMLSRWDDVAIRLIRSGATGVLYPDAITTDFLEALDTIGERQAYLPPALQKTLAQRYVAGAEASIDRLTRRELEFVRRLAEGFSTSEIAIELGLSPKTADTHRANLLRKLGLRNNVDVARLALQHGLVAL